MRDSLQPGRTAYETLGVAEDVDSDGIKKAFRLAMPGNRDLQVLTEAYKTLLDTNRRLLTDLFMYQDGFLAGDQTWRLDQSSLIDQRKELARQIEDAYRADWSDFRCLHALAVLWYWWAVAREEKNLAALKNQSAPICPVLPGSVENPWEPALMCWSTLVAAKDFWQAWTQAKHYELPQDAPDRLQAHLVSRLNNYVDEYNRTQAQKDFARIQKTEELLRNEISAARHLAASGVRLKTIEGNLVPASFGRQTLEWLGLSTLVRNELASLQEKQPENQNLKALARDLSAYGELSQQIKNHRYDQVIKQIMSLSDKEQQSEEVQQILLSAYLEKGSQQAEMGQWSSAVATFIQALQNCLEKMAPVIRKTATDLLRPYIAKLQLSDQPAADSLLDSAFTLLDDAPDLLAKATELHISQAIALINSVAEADREQSGLSRNKAMEQVKQGIAMLEASARHGSKRAKENLDKAKALLKSLEQGIWGISSNVQSQMNQAIEMANHKNYDGAIKIMDKIKEQIPKGEQGRFNSVLGDICNAYGVQLLNEAVEGTKISSESSAEIKATANALKKYLKGSKGKVGFLAVLGLIFRIALLAWISYGVNWLLGRIPSIGESETLKSVIVIAIIIIDMFIMNSMFKKFDKRSKKKQAQKQHSWMDPPRCVKDGCKNFAQYEFDLSKYGYKVKIPLCDWHGKEIRKLITPKIEAYAGLQLNYAVEQFRRAKTLNPNNSTIKENLKVAEDMKSRYQ